MAEIKAGGYTSKYTGPLMEKRLDQGYYDDLVAAGVAAGLYTSAAAPSKADMDKKIATGDIFVINRKTLNSPVIVQETYDKLKYAIQSQKLIMLNTEVNDIAIPAIYQKYEVQGGNISLVFHSDEIEDLMVVYITSEPSIQTGYITLALKSDVVTKTNTSVFNPTGDYNPATKKYVDDNKFPEAPNDAKLYGRKSGAWTEVVIPSVPDMSVVNYMIGKKTVTTLTNLPGDAANIIANVTAATNLTHSGLAEPRQQMIRVNNTTATAITQALPTTGIYQSMAGATVTIPANSYIEISLWAIDGKIVLRVGENS